MKEFDSLNAGWNPLEHISNDGNKLYYQIHMPSALEDGKEYPLIIYMHGAGSKADDNSHINSRFADFLRNFEKGEYKEKAILLAPGCPKSGSWVQKREPSQVTLDHTLEPTVQMKAVIEILENIENNLPVDKKRFYIACLYIIYRTF